MKKSKKIHKIIKAAVEYFSTAGGAVAFVIGIVTVIIVIPPFISVPIIIGIGVGFAAYGAYEKWKKLNANEAKKFMEKHEAALQKELFKRIDNGIEKIAKTELDFESKLEAVEHKIQEKLVEEPPWHIQYNKTNEEDYRRGRDARVLGREEKSSDITQPQIQININHAPGFFTVKAYKDSSGRLVAMVGEEKIELPQQLSLQLPAQKPEAKMEAKPEEKHTPEQAKRKVTL